MPWLIDFARTRRDRIVLDYVQMEIDLFVHLLKPSFFPSLRARKPSWEHVNEFFGGFLGHA